MGVHSTISGESALHSAGDGAWIMMKCAKTLGGKCDLKFSADETVFRFRCPAAPYKEDLMATKNQSIFNSAKFELPKNIYGIAIDDSKIQRKLLARYLTYAGIPKDRVQIYGEDGTQIRNFSDLIVAFVDEHPDDYFLLIVDENLDVDDSHITISGSQMVSKIRARLLPDQERRILALIRSANDSATDVAIYNSRAHGYLPKSPIKQGNGVLGQIAPPWLERFYTPIDRCTAGKGGTGEGATKNSNIPGRPSQELQQHQQNVAMDLPKPASSGSLEDIVMLTEKELVKDIDAINLFIDQKHSYLQEFWPLIYEKLHALKGDLQTINNDERLSGAILTLRAMRGQTLPEDFVQKWNTLRASIVSTLCPTAIPTNGVEAGGSAK